ncbi:diadenosine tetraphosphate (Ap4A) HIT family hydrolase [Melghiribacillus thermohalophilus]|uniref:Diadenosine tetraphosphate (Ap4A) HIT family hydrolase n=1 Tax=Melghiribacillus thermohalophilus TaxID=1324956 RepID=A0A4R3N1F9_9BACI|nr:diadenosine tetraphosphate hydrolase [Melghiribacillus thermohalophilus]TCT20903.1 diadenosine tetraphosphate (Ap4A) HIT family hydrolase [Melghiribacillus thermohalophilus]
MRKMKLSNGRVVEVECLSCAIVNGIVEPDGGTIVESAHFHAHQDVAYPIKGLVILASRRHVKTFDQLTDEEAADYIRILRRIREAQRNVLGIENVYYFYNEDTTHHFHTWMVPRYEWMYEFGRSVESVRPVLLHARKHMNGEQHVQGVRKAIQLLQKELQAAP